MTAINYSEGSFQHIEIEAGMGKAICTSRRRCAEVESKSRETLAQCPLWNTPGASLLSSSDLPWRFLRPAFGGVSLGMTILPRGAARSHASREARHTCRQHWAPHAGPSCLDTQGKSTSRVRSVPMEGNSEVIKLNEYMRASQKRPEALSDTEKCHPPSCIASIATKHC